MSRHKTIVDVSNALLKNLIRIIKKWLSLLNDIKNDIRVYQNIHLSTPYFSAKYSVFASSKEIDS